MLGKLAGALIGSRVAGKNRGARGAILGVAAKRVIPALAALALGGWAYRKWRDKRRAHPAYPSEATPRVPASETRSPS